MNNSFDYLIVGCGLAGITISRLLADLGNSILIVDKRNHIGGLCYDFHSDDNILIHRYGGHIFHTSNNKVWDFLSRFTDWHYYQHKVLSYVDGKVQEFPPRVVQIGQIHEPKNASEFLGQMFGAEVRDKFFKGYSEKQWSVNLEDIPVEIVARVRARTDSDPRYYSDKYQGLPLFGYTRMFERMLDCPNIKVMLNTNYQEINNKLTFGSIIWTGGIDDFLYHKYGKLEYRSRRFVFKTYPVEFFQEGMVINYPNDYDFIRVLELKHATGQKSPLTTVIYEYPLTEGEEDYYPFPTKSNLTLYNKYYVEFQDKYGYSPIHLLGRLAEYKYLDMDKTIEHAFKLFESL